MKAEAAAICCAALRSGDYRQLRAASGWRGHSGLGVDDDQFCAMYLVMHALGLIWMRPKFPHIEFSVSQWQDICEENNISDNEVRQIAIENETLTFNEIADGIEARVLSLAKQCNYPLDRQQARGWG